MYVHWEASRLSDSLLDIYTRLWYGSPVSLGRLSTMHGTFLSLSENRIPPSLSAESRLDIRSIRREVLCESPQTADSGRFFACIER